MTRAIPLPPDDRRQALIDATLPLLLARGPAVTTREIAEAAGIAEGTIFRVFETKQELVQATVAAALRPTETIERLEHLPVGQTLESRVQEILHLLGEEIVRVRSLFVHFAHPPGDAENQPRQTTCTNPRNPHQDLTTAVMAALAPYLDRLDASPDLAARTLISLAFTNNFLFLSHLPTAGSSDLTRVALHGLAKCTRGDSSIPVTNQTEGAS